MQSYIDWLKDAWKNSSLKGKIVFIIFFSFSLTIIGNAVILIFFNRDSPDFVATLIGSLPLSIMFAYFAFLFLQDPAVDTGKTTKERIAKLIEALESSTELISAIEVETQERQQLVERLEEDLATYNELVRLRKPEVEAVAQLLRGELRKEGRKGLWQEILVNGFFFIAGILFTILTGIGG